VGKPRDFKFGVHVGRSSPSTWTTNHPRRDMVTSRDLL